MLVTWLIVEQNWNCSLKNELCLDEWTIDWRHGRENRIRIILYMPFIIDIQGATPSSLKVDHDMKTIQYIAGSEESTLRRGKQLCKIWFRATNGIEGQRVLIPRPLSNYTLCHLVTISQSRAHHCLLCATT